MNVVSYVVLVMVLFAAKGIELLAGVQYNVAGQQVPLSGIVLYALLGAAGVALARRTGFPGMWDADVSNRLRFLMPLGVGALTGMGMVLMDLLLRTGGYGQIPQTALPEGLLVVVIAGITEEIAMRLFLIPLLVGLVSSVLLGGRRQEQVFWGAAVAAAALYGFLAMGALSARGGTADIAGAPPFYSLGLPTILLYSLVAAYFFRRAGFLSTLSLRFGFYFVWHILWPLWGMVP
ncbi:MAG TPA: hypothetical protein VK879_18015 [Candidatus Sulfomarinibacteraceae bacterium]|nr:hypothetical protein [Candidatus Sulfomarinibacteraceae bacterium]